MSLPYKLFKAEHPEYDGAHFEVLEALKAGGKKLTGNERVMRKCLRTNLVEEPEVWKERSARAVVNPYGGEIVEQLCASVFGDPLTIGLCNEDGSTDEPSDEWAEFFEDVSRPGTSKRQTFQQHMAAVLDRLLICGVAYTLVDFPRRDGIEVATLAQESELGLRRPFLLEIDPAAVTEWEDDDTGELLWCMVRSATQRRKALTGDRRMVTLTFRVLTREDWQVWTITYDSKMRPEGPQDEDPVTLQESGAHTFGRVPLVRHRVASKLWAMDRMRSPLCNLLRGQSGYSWIRDKTNCPTPFLKLQNLKSAEETPDPAVEEQGVGRKAPSRVGELAMLGERDELGWSAPPSEPLTEAREGNREAVSELYRVMDAMAQAIDPSASSNKQSGESKAMDATTKAVLAKALGEVVREETLTVLRVIEMGRGDEPADWDVSGCDEVEIETPGAVVADLSALELVTLPPSFRVAEIMRAWRIRHPHATEAETQKVREEAEAATAVDHEAANAEQGARAAIAEETAKQAGEIVKPKPAAKPPGKAAKK